MNASVKRTKKFDADALINKLRRNVARVLNDTAQSHAELASAAAPRSDIEDEDHIHLQDAIKRWKNASESDLRAETQAGVEHGIYVELGHHTKSGSYVAAQPFFAPTAEIAMRECKEDLSNVLK